MRLNPIHLPRFIAVIPTDWPISFIPLARRGHPRAVMHAHRAIWARRMMIRDWYDLNAEDRLLHAGAFNWTFTLGTGLMDPWSVGATALIPEPKFDLKLLPLLLARHDATLFAAAPGVIRKLNAALPDQFRIPKLRHVLSAGEKLSPEVRSTWRMKTGVDIYEAFGMSECSTFLSSAPHLPQFGSGTWLATTWAQDFPACG